MVSCTNRVNRLGWAQVVAPSAQAGGGAIAGHPDQHVHAARELGFDQQGTQFVVSLRLAFPAIIMITDTTIPACWILTWVASIHK
jgi:hypothetical protein